MHVVVVDDEAPARDELIYLLKQQPDIEVVGEAEDAASAVQICRRERPDVVFLDIHMPGGDGMGAARQLAALCHPPLLVFATAYDQHALEAFEVNAVDYLLKPFAEERVSETVEKLRKLVKKRPAASIIQQKIAVHNEDEIKLLDPQEIVFAARQGREVIVKTIDRQYQVGFTLQQLETKVDNYGFFRPHNSFLVNANMIEKIEPWFNGYQLVMKDKDASKVPVSRSGMKQIRRLLDI